MSAYKEPTTAVIMPRVSTWQAILLASARKDTQEMDSYVKVRTSLKFHISTTHWK